MLNLSLIYTAIVSFALSFSALYLVDIARKCWYSSEYYYGHARRLLRACHAVVGTRVGYTTHGASDGEMRYTSSTYQYDFQGKSYRYVNHMNKDLGDTVTLFFLENPKAACLPVEFAPKKFVWTKYILPLGILLTVLLHGHIDYWMSLVH